MHTTSSAYEKTRRTDSALVCCCQREQERALKAALFLDSAAMYATRKIHKSERAE
jgi:hypothetical protein